VVLPSPIACKAGKVGVEVVAVAFFTPERIVGIVLLAGVFASVI